VLWLRLLVAGLSPRRPGFDPGSVHVGFVVDKVALGQVFPPEYFGFPLSISFHRCSITWKNKKKLITFLFIFITRVAEEASRLWCDRSFCCGAPLPPPPPKKKKPAWCMFILEGMVRHLLHLLTRRAHYCAQNLSWAGGSLVYEVLSQVTEGRNGLILVLLRATSTVQSFYGYSDV
jgi:hypothetical protein